MNQPLGMSVRDILKVTFKTFNTDLNNSFPALFYTSTREIPTLLYPSSLKEVPLSGGTSPPVLSIIGSATPPPPGKGNWLTAGLTATHSKQQPAHREEKKGSSECTTFYFQEYCSFCLIQNRGSAPLANLWSFALPRRGWYNLVPRAFLFDQRPNSKGKSPGNEVGGGTLLY